MRFAITGCIALLLSFRLGAQDTTQVKADSTAPGVVRPYRNPQRARILGILIPGAGHIYSGEYLKGFVAYEGTVGGLGMGVLVFMVNKCTFSFLSDASCDPRPEWPHRALGVAIAGMGMWAWISSARDAPHAAERANGRHAARASAIAPYIAPFSGAGNASQFGVSLHW
jgi:hypothetical protein